MFFGPEETVPSVLFVSSVPLTDASVGIWGNSVRLELFPEGLFDNESDDILSAVELVGIISEISVFAGSEESVPFALFDSSVLSEDAGIKTEGVFVWFELSSEKLLDKESAEVLFNV